MPNNLGIPDSTRLATVMSRIRRSRYHCHAKKEADHGEIQSSQPGKRDRDQESQTKVKRVAKEW